MIRSLGLVMLLAAAPAQAAVGTCLFSGDGTPCVSACITSGVCLGGACSPITLRGDDSPCASENRCTEGDYCHSGECVAGSTPVVCPDLDSCHVGVCNPQVGCTTNNICLPDLSGPDLAETPPDLAEPTPDLTTTPPPDLATPPPPPDMATVPPSPDMVVVDAPDLAPVVTPFGSVFGSDVAAGCAAVPGQTPTALAWIAFLIVAIFVARRRV